MNEDGKNGIEYLIKSVRVVDGNILNPHWKGKIQLVVTDKGEYIDNMPGEQFGNFEKAKPGYDWEKRIGEKVVDAVIFKSAGYLWINYQGDDNN